MFTTNAITLDFKCEDRPQTKADFTYQISPNTIEIVDTGRGKLSVADDLDAVVRRIEYWHMGSVNGFSGSTALTPSSPIHALGEAYMCSRRSLQARNS
jgi:hypothetical protein